MLVLFPFLASRRRITAWTEEVSDICGKIHEPFRERKAALTLQDTMLKWCCWEEAATQL